MFKQAQYIRNSFSINFQRYQHIRRKAIEFEDLLNEKLAGHYSQPQVVSVPDELDPEVPRLIFSSKHGYSQIIISQISMSLNVVYSPDWQTDISKGRDYLLERSKALYLLLGNLKDIQICYSGLTTSVHISTDANNDEILNHLYKCFGLEMKDDNIHDIQLKVTTVDDDKYYNNITISNFRAWNVSEETQNIVRYSNNKIAYRGLEISADFNDRHSYNENDNYNSDPAIIEDIINKGLEHVNTTIERVGSI